MRYCPRCGENYEEKDAKDHRVCRPATNTSQLATNKVVTNATNGRTVKRADVAVRAVPEVPAEVAVENGAEAQRTKNRRMREVYNAYQREYMKKRRAGGISGPVIQEKGTPQ